MNKFKISFLEEASFEQFKLFLESLDEENKTWSLDLQTHKDEKSFYTHKKSGAFIGLYENNIISLVDAYDFSYYGWILISFVVKTEYQGQGIGTKMLNVIEDEAKKRGVIKACAKHYKDNIASHKAFLKAGYKEWKEENNLVWKIKEL